MNFPYFCPACYVNFHKEASMTTENFLEVFAAKEAQRFKLKVGVILVLIKEGKILLQKRCRTGIADGTYSPPMGGHDGKEPLSQAAIREAKEEINIDIEPEDLSVCHVMHRFYPMPQGLSFEQIDVYFRINKYKGTLQNNEPDRCVELAFFPLHDLPMPMDALFCQGLKCIEEGIFYSEFGFN